MNDSEDYIDLIELKDVFWSKKIFISSVVLISIFISIFYSLSLPNKYISTAILTPNENENEQNLRDFGQLGGLAGLAGVDIGGNSSSKTSIAIEVMKSHDFFSIIISDELLINLFATKGWDKESNSIKIDKNIYNYEDAIWVRSPTSYGSSKPTIQEAHEEFLKYFSVVKNKDNDLITISFEHYSPFYAKEMVQKIIKTINEKTKYQDMLLSQRALDYLNKKLYETDLEEIRSGISNLILKELSSLMLSELEEDYLFRVLDKPKVPELKSGPKRFNIVLLVAVSSLLLTLMIVFSQHYIPKYFKNLKNPS